jgi:hypothetical protein
MDSGGVGTDAVVVVAAGAVVVTAGASVVLTAVVSVVASLPLQAEAATASERRIVARLIRMGEVTLEY